MRAMSRDASKTPDAFPAHRATTLTLPRINRAVGTTLAVEKEATAQRVGNELEACSAGFSTAGPGTRLRFESPARRSRRAHPPWHTDRIRSVRPGSVQPVPYSGEQHGPGGRTERQALYTCPAHAHATPERARRLVANSAMSVKSVCRLVSSRRGEGRAIRRSEPARRRAQRRTTDGPCEQR